MPLRRLPDRSSLRSGRPTCTLFLAGIALEDRDEGKPSGTTLFSRRLAAALPGARGANPSRLRVSEAAPSRRQRPVAPPRIILRGDTIVGRPWQASPHSGRLRRQREEDFATKTGLQRLPCWVPVGRVPLRDRSPSRDTRLACDD